jgi:3-dehydrosphinganine reductase
VYPPDVDTPQLADENRYKPAETAAISGSVKPMSAEAVAAATVRAIERKRYAVYPDRSIGLLAAFGPLIAPILRKLVDRRVRRTRRA